MSKNVQVVTSVMDAVVPCPDPSFRAEMLVPPFLDVLVAEGSQLSLFLHLPSAEKSHLAQGQTAFPGSQHQLLTSAEIRRPAPLLKARTTFQGSL